MELSLEVLEGIRTHARESLPAECCGLLIGRVEAGARQVLEAIRTPNEAPGDRSRTYRIPPAEFWRAERRAAARGLRVVGAYHSHPGAEAQPSPADLEDALPSFAYVILGPAPAFSPGAWVLEDDRSGFRPEPLVRPARRTGVR